LRCDLFRQRERDAQSVAKAEINELLGSKMALALPASLSRLGITASVSTASRSLLLGLGTRHRSRDSSAQFPSSESRIRRKRCSSDTNKNTNKADSCRKLWRLFSMRREKN
jgi:hypothetical protein